VTLAIVGLGKWGKNLVKEFSKISTISHAISKGNKSNINWLNRNYPHIIHTYDFESILKNPSITSIIIATPISTHYNLVIQALKNKKNVFVEKTLSENSSDALKLLKIAKENKCNLFVGHVFNYHPIFKKIIELDKKEKIQFMKFQWNKPESSTEDIFLDLVSHDLFLISKLFGKPKSIRKLYSFKIFNPNDFILLEVKFPNIICILDVNRCSTKKSKIVSFQTQKNLYVWEDYSLKKFNTSTKKFNYLYKSNKTSLELECKEFLKTNKTQNDYSNAKHSVQVLKLLECIK